MGEALIVSRGFGSSGSSGNTLISQIFLENTIWKAPKIPDQNFSVRIFGGGEGGTSNAGGGGGGYGKLGRGGGNGGIDGGFAARGAGYNNGDDYGNGICIIQYYI